METRYRLHPLLAAAAVSLIVLSGVGIAVLTGVLPHSRGSDAAAPEAPKPKRVARHAPPHPAPVQVAATEPPPPPVAQTPAPLPGVGGVVESVKQVEQKAGTAVAGPILGGIAGAVLGHQVGSGTGRAVATVVGAGAGVLGGKVIEDKVRATKHWETTVRLDNGSAKTISSEAQPVWHAGERVRVVDGQILKS